MRTGSCTVHCPTLDPVGTSVGKSLSGGMKRGNKREIERETVGDLCPVLVLSQVCCVTMYESPAFSFLKKRLLITYYTHQALF